MNQDQQCPTTQTLSDLMDGRMVEPDLSRFSAHLEECSRCQAQVKTISSSDTLVEILRTTSLEFENIIEETPSHLLERLKQIPITTSKGSMNGAAFLAQNALSQQNEHSIFTPAENQDEIGRFGDYRILNELGRGGMGVVFRAEEIPLQRLVAIKIMSQRIASLPEAKERFLKEAKAAASLKNDHIVTIYRVDEFQGVPFVAMELLHGESMDASLREGEPWCLPKILQTASDVARGLTEAHAKGMIHRDIKPGNLWLETTGQATLRTKILDFGLVRSELDDMQKTMTGTIVGTPAFMSPEQARGDKGLDARADIFSLGCVLYRLATGQLPFQSETMMGTLMALAMHDPVPPEEINSDIPSELSQLITEMLQKEPSRRPPSAQSIIDRLTDISMNPTRRKSSSRRSKLSKPLPFASLSKAKRNGLAIACALFVLVALSVYGGTLFWQTADGKIVRVECNDPSISIAVQNGELKIAGAYKEPISIKPGNVDLQITKKQEDGEDFTFDTNKLIVRKGEQVVLRIESIEGKLAIIQEGKGVLDQVDLPFVNTTGETAADRIAAIRLLSIGASIEMNNGRWLESGDELPKEPFTVTQVKLEGNRKLTNDLASQLKELKHVKSLDLEISSITDDALKYVGCMEELTYLNLYGTKITDVGMMHLGGLKNLREIGLGGRIPITDKGAAILKEFSKLEAVYLDGTQITDDTIKLLKTLDALIDVNIAVTPVTREGVKMLSEIKSLKKACFLSTPLDDDLLKTITRNVDFESLNLGATRITDNGLKLLFPLKKLRSLWLLHNRHSADSIAELHAQLPHCRIYLDDRTIDPE